MKLGWREGRRGGGGGKEDNVQSRKESTIRLKSSEDFEMIVKDESIDSIESAIIKGAQKDGIL